MCTHDWILFASAALALNLTPGPDMLYISARSAGQGRRAGILSALGVAGGGAVHTCLVAFGLAGLLAKVPVAYDIVRYTGAAYLVFLGVRMLLTSPASAARPLSDDCGRKVFVQGLLTNVLNPKVALFFVAFLPQFADPARGALWWQLLMLGASFNLSGTLVNMTVALAASAGRSLLPRRSRSGAWLHRVSAAVFVGLGARLAFAGNR
jgi:threonine/homoserine/homoserine lactone efflux protein